VMSFRKGSIAGTLEHSESWKEVIDALESIPDDIGNAEREYIRNWIEEAQGEMQSAQLSAGLTERVDRALREALPKVRKRTTFKR
jgi:hypothetical protein